jgi:hypothetical protein
MSDLSGVPIKGRVARFIKLDSCGNPITGASGLQVITNGFISVQMEPQYEDGEQQRQRLADGSFCVQDNDPPSWINDQLTIMLCGVCPSVDQIVSGARLLTTGATTGIGAAYSEGLVTARFSLELWQNMSGAGQCDPATGAPRYLYHAWPNVGNAKMGQSTVENAPFTKQYVAQSDSVGTLWGDGPGSLGPWAGAFAANEHYLWAITDTAPPTVPANCGATAIT